MDRKREYQRNETDGTHDYEVPEKRVRATMRVAMAIPESCVGLVIGRQGSEIKSISEASSCQIQVSTDKSTAGWRMVEMDGLAGQIETAKQMINAVVARGTLPALPIDTGMAQNQVAQPGRITVEMWIPANRCGRVIGKGGETMRRLRSDYNCMIFLIQDFKNQDNNPKLLKITGPPADVERVKQTVQLLIDSCDVNPVNPSGETSTVQLKVPRSSVGAIMGVRGTNIMKLSRDTGCKIQFVTEDNAVIQERVMIVVGHPNCVNLAVQAIKAIVDTNTVEMGKQMIYCLTVPASKCGLVIGRGGESIKQINAESGAYCELSKDPNQKPNEKTFVIKGTEQQVEHAKHLICVRVGDIPATTPFNPLAQQLQLAYQSQLIASSYQSMMLQSALHQPYQSYLQSHLYPTPTPSPQTSTPSAPPPAPDSSSGYPTDKNESSDEWMQYYFPGYSSDEKDKLPSY